MLLQRIIRNLQPDLELMDWMIKLSDLSEGFNERQLLDLNQVNEYLKSQLAQTQNELS